MAQGKLHVYSIMGLIDPDFGKIKLNGTNITDYPVHLRAKIGLGYFHKKYLYLRNDS